MKRERAAAYGIIQQTGPEEWGFKLMGTGRVIGNEIPVTVDTILHLQGLGSSNDGDIVKITVEIERAGSDENQD